jgi:hypothetical protein
MKSIAVLRLVSSESTAAEWHFYQNKPPFSDLKTQRELENRSSASE